MIAQAGATLISLGRKPGKNTTGKGQQVGKSHSSALQFPQSLPANRAAMPSCERILRITLMVDVEKSLDTGNKKANILLISPRWRYNAPETQRENYKVDESSHDYISLHPALPVPPAFLFWLRRMVT